MVEFKLPDLGEGVQEGEITKWLVKAGDAVREDQSLLEVMTDKVTAEIPSPFDGVVVDLLAAEGAVVPVGTPLLRIAEAAEEEPPTAPSAPHAAHGLATRLAGAPPPSAGVDDVPPRTERGRPATAGGGPAANGEASAASLTGDRLPTTDGGRSSAAGGARSQPADRIRAVPLVRKLARDLGIDLTMVAGTGPAGRITEADVREASSRLQAPGSRPDIVAGHPPGERAATRLDREPRVPSRERERIDEPVPLRGMRRRIAERMVEALRVSAPVTYVDEVDMSALVALREKARATAERQGVKLTYLPFVLKAAAAALREHPRLNAVMDNEKGEILLKKEYHLGIACETDEGLLVPVIRNVDRKTLFDLAREIEAVVDRARAGKLDRAELQGGTFTVTSMGALGGLFATPILNVPEVAILAVHKISKRPVVRDDQIVARDMAHLSLTFDHRALDGRDAARFVNSLIAYLEDPNLLLLT